MKSCLLVIDAQESFRHRPYFSAARLDSYLMAQNALIGGCLTRGVAVVRILHSDGPDQPDNPFAVASGLVRPLEGLHSLPTDSAEFRKTRHSALVGTGLEVWLTAQGIGHLLISGLRTEQCCETTTRHASDLGWGVDYVTAATCTFDLEHPGGAILTADAMVERTEAALHARFATVCSVDQALARLDARRAMAA